MSELKGTIVLAPIVPPSDDRTYPTHISEYGKGGLHSVESLIDRDAIPVERRTVGMMCFVATIGRTFQLKGGIENGNWQELQAAGGSGSGGGDMSQYIYDIDGDGKVDSAEQADVALVAQKVDWYGIQNVPTSFQPKDHTHVANDITTDINHMFVSQVEKDTWNAKADAADTYTKAQTDAKIAAVVDAAPETLNTLNELAQALNDDPNFATTIANQIGNKVDKIVGKGLSTNDFTDLDKFKLDTLQNYTHPATHPASMILTDSTRQFVTDNQINLWTNKQDALGFVPENTAKKGIANGYASLDASGKVPVGQLPQLGFNSTSVVVDAIARAALTGQKTGDIAYETSTGDSYIWDGTLWKLMADKDWANINVDWSNITSKPASTVAAIDAAVLHDHTHINKAILDATEEIFTTVLKNKIGDADTIKSIPVDLTGAVNGYSLIYSNGKIVPFPIASGGAGGTGSGDMLISVYDTNNNGVVDRAESADSVEWNNIINKPSTFPILAHKSSHAIGGTDVLTPTDIGAADAVTVGNHISNMSNPHNTTKAQVGLANVTNDAQVKRTEMGVINGVATLDGSGKIPQSQLPALAVNNTFVVNSQSAMLALTAVQGDIAIRSDLSKSYILQAYPPTTLTNWQELLAPTGTGIQSINGQTGMSITLSTSNIAEGTNLYFTDARVTSNPTVQGHITNYNNPHNTTKTQVGLGNVTNDAQVKRSEMGAANGVATLGADGLIPTSQLPAGAGGTAPVTSVNGKVGSVILTTSDITESTNMFYTDVRVDARIQANSTISSLVTHTTRTDNPHNVTKAQLSLGNVTNDAQVKRTEMGVANGVATLGSDGKIPANQIPALGINNTFVVATESAMLALSTAVKGDVAIRTDINKSFILSQIPASTIGNWQELLAPTGSGVTTVNGQAGPTVTLTTSNIAEGTNLYYTDARVANAPALTSHINNTNNPHTVTKAQVGLSNVDNVQQIPMSQRGVANGVATLGADGKIPAAQLPAGSGSGSGSGSGGGVVYTRYQAGQDCYVIASAPGVTAVKSGPKFILTVPDGVDVRTVQGFCSKTEISTGLTMSFDVYPNASGSFADFRMPVVAAYYPQASAWVPKASAPNLGLDGHTIDVKALQSNMDHWVVLQF